VAAVIIDEILADLDAENDDLDRPVRRWAAGPVKRRSGPAE
jgi:hypothetical protein